MKISYNIILAILILGWIGGRSAQADSSLAPLVAIDPGHGGSDTGVRAGVQIEKDWNLKVALALQKAFQAAGYQVLMTRQTDVTVDPETRLNMLNSSDAKVVLSIHADREWTGFQNGPFLVVEPPNQMNSLNSNTLQPLGAITQAQYHLSLQLAQDIGQQLGVNTALSDLSDSRGLVGEAVSPNGRIACLPHQSLRNLAKVAVMITPLFLTSQSDIEKMSDPTALDHFATQVVQGVSNDLKIADPVGAGK